MVNTTAAIMALPAPLENIRLVGDEDKHATLLFFGETSTLPQEAKSVLTDAVAMATRMLFPFSESVREVSRLGNENPPALVAMLSAQNLPQVRNLFMMNPAVEGYLGNTEQFPSFTPHVTLGHPDFAEEVVLRTLMRQLYRVSFDRLAVWWNDERIEYDLNQSEDSIAMSEAIENFLEHSGTKGMKWGVRKDGPSDHSVFVATPAAGGRAPKVGDMFVSGGQNHTVVRTKETTNGSQHVVTTRPTSTVLKEQRAEAGSKIIKIIKKDKEYWKKAAAVGTVAAVGLAAAALAPAALPASAVLAAGGPAVLSSKIALGTGIATRVGYFHNYLSYRARSKAGNVALTHAVMQDERTVGQVYDDLTPPKKLSANLLVDAYSRGVEFADDPDVQGGWADMSPTERSVVLFLASGTDSPDATAAHTDTVDDVLKSIVNVEEEDAEQSGVRGMHWGIRRKTDPATGRVEMTGTTGLVPRGSSADQITQDRIAKKLTTGGVKSVSNADIQAYARRLQLQSDLQRTLDQQSAAQKAKSDGFIKSFVKKQADRQTNRIVNAAMDIAVEKALEQAGVKISGGKLSDFDKEHQSKSELGDTVQQLSKRIKPKKG